MGRKIIGNYCTGLSYDVKNYVDRLGDSLCIAPPPLSKNRKRGRGGGGSAHRLL